jgi:hypothetical protein
VTVESRLRLEWKKRKLVIGVRGDGCAYGAVATESRSGLSFLELSIVVTSSPLLQTVDYLRGTE